MISSDIFIYMILIIALLSAPVLIHMYQLRQRLLDSESFLFALERCLKREINLLKDESLRLKDAVQKLKERKTRKKYITKKRSSALRKQVNGEQSPTELPTS